MRISGEGGAARDPDRRGAGFDDALLRARDAGENRRSATAVVRSAQPCRAAGRLERGRAARLAEPGPRAPAPEPGRSDLASDPAPVAELAAVVRALPPVIAASRGVDAPLALSFGRSLQVELRSTPAGVELVLRPEASLARAAEAELPRMLAALRVRGVVVARAEVRPRPGAGGRRVDGRGRLR